MLCACSIPPKNNFLENFSIFMSNLPPENDVNLTPYFEGSKTEMLFVWPILRGFSFPWRPI